ncbi:Carboxylesterase [Chamberlinius hualienensis]
MVVCLRQRPLSDFHKVNVQVSDYMIAFGPTIDGIVIPSEPRQAMHDFGEQYSKYDLMVGVTKVEALSPFSSDDLQFGLEPERRDAILRTFLTSTYEYHLNEIFALLVNEYTDWTRPSQHPLHTRDATIEIISDALVVAPLVTATTLHASPKHNTYFYNFAYQSRGVDYPRRLGCFTGEDMPYVFGAPLVDSLGVFHRNFTKDERFLSETVMVYWTNFARTGDPNQVGRPVHDSGRNRSRFSKVVWPHYDTNHESYLSIGMRSKGRQHYRAHKLSVWLRLIPLIHQEDKENTGPNHHQLNRSHNISNIGVYRRPGGPSKYPAYPSVTPYSNQSLNGRSNYSAGGPHGGLTSGGDGDSVSAVRPSWPTSPPVGLPPLYGNGDVVTFPSTTRQDHSKDGNASDKLQAEAIFHGSYSTALSVTIAVGCSLLILNVLIFAGIYYQRDKNRLEAKLHKKNYKLKKVNEDLRCQAASLAACSSQSQKQPLGSGLPRAPPPSPVGQSSRLNRETSDHVVHFPPASVVAQTLGNLKTPPKVPQKPNSTLSGSRVNLGACELTSLTEVQPLLSQNNISTGTLKSLNKTVGSCPGQKTQEIRV